MKNVNIGKKNNMNTCGHNELNNNCWECTCDSLKIENAKLFRLLNIALEELKRFNDSNIINLLEKTIELRNKGE